MHGRLCCPSPTLKANAGQHSAHADVLRNKFKKIKMDRILKSNLDEFVQSFGYESEPTEKVFEKFVNFSALSNEFSQKSIGTFEIDQVSVGGNGDIGLDGVSIIANGDLIFSKEQVDDLIDLNGYLEIEFVVTQAKTSPSFSGAEIGTFLFGVEDLFSELIDDREHHPRRNEDILAIIELLKYIFDRSAKMDRGLPKLILYYVTTGVWDSANHDLVSRFESGKRQLDKMRLFSSVTYHALGADEVTRFYRNTKSKEYAEISFSNKITLPEIAGIKEGYFGVIPFSEYKKLIIDENDNLKNVFYDNIRSYQGDNLVNKDIDKTLKDGKFDLFTVMNNGVTVLSKSLTPAGNKFTLKDYQIVNGCQTSHVLYFNRNLNGINTLQIPIRIVVSDNEDVKNQVIIATNSQTEVKREQLVALSEYQKKLESYYNSIIGTGRLYYERRSKQYNAENSVPKSKIISIPVQIISFTSMILDEPHNVRGYYSKVVENIEKAGKFIFADNHECAPYYMSALAYHRLEYLFRANILDNQFKKAKFHLLLTFRLLAETREKPKFMNDKAFEKYCQPIIEKLNDMVECERIFKEACEVLLSTLPNQSLHDRFINKLLTQNIGRKLNKIVR
jgi:hypothetical protein